MRVLYNSVFDVPTGSSANSSDSFRDERWTSSFGNVGEEDEKALLKRLRLLAKRREKERGKKGGRKKGFALADEDDDQGEEGLTHGGVPLAALGDADLEDKDRDGLLGDNLTGELGGEGTVFLGVDNDRATNKGGDGKQIKDVARALAG